MRKKWIVILALVVVCGMAQASMVFVENWSSSGGGVWNGTAGGVNVTLTASDTWSAFREQDVSGWQYAANRGSSTQDGLGVGATPGWTLTTSAPCDIYLYATWWRGEGLDGASSTGIYEFNHSFTIASGLGNATIVGNNLDLGLNEWGMGIMSFTNTSALACNTGWTGGGSEVGMVFAVQAIPEPASALLIGCGGLLVVGYRRMRKSYGHF